MLRAMYSGISGLRNFQTKLDVIGNNIANVNTVGFKAGRVMFKDILSQTVQGASGPDANRGGTNPKQIGLGSTIGSIDTIFTTGGYMTTNVATDLLINGDGFFVVEDANKSRFLTRAGNFTVDANNQLVTSDGLRVIGINIDNTNTPPTTYGPIVLDGKPGWKVKDVRIGADGVVSYTLESNDPSDQPETYPQFDPNTGDPTHQRQIALVKMNNPAGLEKVGDSLYVPTPNADNVINNQNVLSNLTQLPNILAQPGTLGTGTLVSGVLEMSNVDLANEFTEMIVAQRAFQANTRIITASDEVLQELVNMKR